MVEILKCEDPAGRVPFDRRLRQLRDDAARSAMLIRLRRLSIGLSGDSRPVSGTKATQVADIARAREHLQHHGGKAKH